MKFEVTSDNKAYLEARGKIVLNACPGSGKTTAVSFKLTKLTEECEQNYGTFAGIACLSFTNVAKEEIINKYALIKGSTLGFPHIVSTIDSFVNHYVTLPFYYMLGVKSKRPSILNTVSFMDDINLGYFKTVSNKPLKFSYKPSKLKIEIDGTYSWDGHKPNPKIVNNQEFEKFASKYKNWQIDNGYLNNDDSTYIACFLLENFPEIGKSLVQRFPYIIIDEAQDTSEIQYKIFDLLIAAGLSNIEFVGDPYQSLYEFREARPDLFIQRFNDVATWQQVRLTNCRRSSQGIIDVYSIFRNATEEAIVSACLHTTDHKLKIIRYDPGNLDALIEKYKSIVGKDSDNYILVRGGTHLEKFGVKPSAEDPWKSGLAKTLINAQRQFELGNSKLCIDALRMFIAEITIPKGDYKERKNEEQRLKEDIDLNIKLFHFLNDMPSIDDTLDNWTQKMVALVKSKLGIDIDLELKKKGAAFYAQNIKEILFPEVVTPFPVSTIHKVKGMTFKSVLLVLSESSSGEQLSVRDFVQPKGLPTEKQRMLYVALSRPESICCLAIPNTFTELEITAQLRIEIDFVR
ncbi:MAG: UvrD-helicase domain-containing protein [Pedobacter sp.]|uniref:UvrD-helicase domain-containing protein n=1 Tax=Pedobacter sp. TaxID=1411316 RepID=UPI003561740D